MNCNNINVIIFKENNIIPKTLNVNGSLMSGIVRQSSMLEYLNIF